MKDFIPTTQKIVATCILEKDNKVLLLRSNQLVDGLCELMDTSYFDIPRFKISFGKNPEEIIRERFIEYFEQEISSMHIEDIRSRMIENDSIQIFEIIYKIKCEDSMPFTEEVGKFFFADIDNLDEYMLTPQHEHICNYLHIQKK